MAMPLQGTERCTLYTHLARIHTRNWSRACGSSCSSSHWSVLCVRCLQSIHCLACMPCFAHCLTRHWLHLHRALLPHLLCCSRHTGLPLPLRKLDSCLADLPNSLRSHSERIGNQSWFCQRHKSDSILWKSWGSQEPVLSSTKSRSFTCSFPRPRTYSKRASQSAWVTNHGFTSATDSGANWGFREDHTTGTCAVKHEEQIIVDMLVSQTKDIPHEGVSERIGNKSWFYPRPWFGRKLWNCGSYAGHSTESRSWTCPLPAAGGSCWGDQGMPWNLKECTEMVRLLSTEFQASGWASFCCASPEPRFWKRWCLFFAALSQ